MKARVRSVWAIAGLVWAWTWTPLTPRAAAQDVDARVYSTADGSGTLVAADFDFGPRNPIFRNAGLCFPSACLYSSTDPGFRTPTDDRPGEGLFALNAGTQVSLELVALAAGVDAVVVQGTRLDAPGEAAPLGVAPSMHTHPIYQVIVPDGTLGDFPVQLRLRATGGGAYAPSTVYTLTLSSAPSPTPSPSPSPTPSPTQTPTATVAVAPDPYLMYRASGSKLESPSDNHRFPADWNIQLDVAALANEPAGLFTDDPENYTVKLADGLGNPAATDGQAISRPELHYIRYKLKPSRQGAGATLASGKLPKSVKAPRRLWQVTSSLGSLAVETKAASWLLLPAGKSETGPASDPGDAAHFLCYRAKAAPLASDQSPDGSFRKDLQAFVADQFADCARLADGVTVPFPGTAVESTCLVDLQRPVALCQPVTKSAVAPPRVTSAEIDGSVPPSGTPSLVCYQTRNATKVRNAGAASLGGLAPGSRVKQAAHVRREQRSGTALATHPGNRFPRPVAMDTKRLEQLCVPSAVLEVAHP